mmetsp:Transcript_16466/g.27591  ORF Transcript_16466/g.27591 Transcript_16466/m.27591 type:complete len:255 (+) Transcript_16466:98-862(+)
MSKSGNAGSDLVAEPDAKGGSKINLQDKLFNLRMKINQGRKANKDEVEEEYKRFSDPKYEQRQRYLKKVEEAKATSAEEEDAHDPSAPATNVNKKWKKEQEDLMSQTAQQAELVAERAAEKAANAATFGWHAFTADATHRAYEKRLKKLPTNQRSVNTSSSSGSSSSSHLEENPLEYGSQSTAKVTQAGLDRISKDVHDRDDARAKFSKRRMHLDATDVDYINDKNAQFNKKLKKSFDKYTVEIRQNLERGTAV